MTPAEIQALNKRACELLKVARHEMLFRSEPCVCSCDYSCKTIQGMITHIKRTNPDFTTDSGKVELLRLMRKREDWRAFICYLIHVASWNPEDWESSHHHLIETITDTTGLLPKAAVEWMEGRK